VTSGKPDLASRYAAFLAGAPERTAIIAGIAWRWRESGTGSSTVVLLPGAVGSASLFFLVALELAPIARILTVDLPYSSDAGQVVDGLDRLLADRRVDRAILLGASFSGLLVQAYARRHPARTRAIILSHTGALEQSRAKRMRVFASRAAKIPLWATRSMLRIVVRLLLRGVPERRFWVQRYDAALDALTREDVVSRYLLEAGIEELESGAWDGDVLVIHSDNDAIAKPETRARLREVYPRAAWVEFPGGGHSSYTRDPGAYAAAIRRFCGALWQR
jgi:pimeloyl-ACP methyl ester carboxylesterase